MASYTISPSTNGIPLINSVPFPVPYVGSTGYAQYNYLQEVSAEKLVPYIKNVSTTEFTSGNYASFQSPVGYTIPAHNLPCFETSEVLLASDDFTIFAPHKGYIIGSNADQMTGIFPINIFSTDYVSNGVTVPPMGDGQSLFIGINKIVGSNIDWSGSNITNNGLDVAYIASATYLFFEIQFIGGVYQIVNWIIPYGITAGRIVPNTITGLGAGGNIGAQQVNNYNLAPAAAVANLGFTPANANKFPVGSSDLQAGVAVANLGFTPANANKFPVGNSDLQAGVAVANLGFTPANANKFPVGNSNLQAGVAVANLGFTPEQSITIKVLKIGTWRIVATAHNTIPGRTVSIEEGTGNRDFKINYTGFTDSNIAIQVSQDSVISGDSFTGNIRFVTDNSYVSFFNADNIWNYSLGGSPQLQYVSWGSYTANTVPIYIKFIFLS